MRKIATIIAKLLFRFCRLFPVKPSKIVLLKNFPVWGSLGAVGDYLESRGRWHVLRLSPRSPLLLYYLATARAVLLNNNVSPLAWLPFSPKTQLIQLWHADGALKQWGCSCDNAAPRYPYSAVVCASETIRPFWADAFGLPLKQVLPLGSPRLDALALPCDQAALRQIFNQRYPKCQNKRLVLYAPTFRDNFSKNESLLDHFDFSLFAARFPDAALLVRMHPKIHGAYDLRGTGAIDVTNEPDAAGLLRIADWLITDYSSLCVDAAALGCPTALYLFDETQYLAQERGFYKPFRELAPGPIANTFAELLDILAAPDCSEAQRRAFAAFHAGRQDGGACARIEALITNRKEAFPCAEPTAN